MLSSFVRSSQEESGVSSIPIYKGASLIKRQLSFFGIGMMVSVGYMDPGNWATDIAGGALYGYALLFVIACSSLIAMLLQYLALKLGIATDKDLAQACRAYLPRRVNFVFWVLCELAIIACDLAELVGTAIALKLLFDIPILVGVCITVVDVFFILYLQGKGFRKLEMLIISLVMLVFLCFGYEILMLHPPIQEIVKGFVPSQEIFSNSQMLFIAVGILGATVMPHNLYLHSSLVKTRMYDRNDEGRRYALRYATWDSCISLFFAFFVNAAILILSATVFHGSHAIDRIEDAYLLLSPLMSDEWASRVFAIALLCAGQSSTITGTLAGQIVMEGFLHLKIAQWKRRLITRLLAIIPAFLVISIVGEQSTSQLLILSQVVLSMQLGFAVIPLVYYTSSRRVMGEFVNSFAVSSLSWIAGIIICLLNLYLLGDFLFGL